MAYLGKRCFTFLNFYKYTEECYIIEGRVMIECEGEIYHLEPGDFVHR